MEKRRGLILTGTGKPLSGVNNEAKESVLSNFYSQKSDLCSFSYIAKSLLLYFYYEYHWEGRKWMAGKGKKSLIMFW